MSSRLRPLAADLHSRSIAAGYEVQLLEAAHVVVVGAGAIGQNAIQSLALAGVGGLTVVDHDLFEPHNLTRSPLHPTPIELHEWGSKKAVGVARKAARLMTAAGGRTKGFATTIEAVPGVLVGADVVVAAVDTIDTRRFLARWCRLLGKPLVEAGFQAADLNISVYGAEPAEACYGCLDAHHEDGLSCMALGRVLLHSPFAPAIQSAAAVCGGLIAEQVIDLLHGRSRQLNHQLFFNLRSYRSSRGWLQRHPACRLGHDAAHSLLTIDEAPASWAELLRHAGTDELHLSSPLVLSTMCPRCRRWCRPDVPAWCWRLQPRCAACREGGHRLDDAYAAFDICVAISAIDAGRAAATVPFPDLASNAPLFTMLDLHGLPTVLALPLPASSVEITLDAGF